MERFSEEVNGPSASVQAENVLILLNNGNPWTMELRVRYCLFE
jgi:hypothetical protein